MLPATRSLPMPEDGTTALLGILLLTDEPSRLERIDICLEASSLSYDLLAVASLEEGLDVLQEASFDVILLDASISPGEVPPPLLSASSGAVILLLGNASASAILPRRVQDRLDLDSLDGPSLGRSIRHALDRAAWISAEKSSRLTSSPFGSSFYRGVFDAFGEPLLVLDKSQQIILLNRAASELLETGPNSLVGEVFPLDARADADLLIDIPGVDGSMRRVQLQAVDFAHLGEPRILIVLRDVSGRTEPEGEPTREQEQELGAGGAGEGLQNETLQSISQLAGGIAHDFNNILTAVLGNLSMVRMALGPAHGEAGKLLSAEKAALQAQGLTRQLLTFSKGGAPEIEATTLDELVRDCAEFILRGSNVRFELLNDPALWAVDADKGQISQVINNLVINADQAMPDGGVLTLGLENRNLAEEDVPGLDPGCYVCLAVRDNGTGIPPDVLERVFDPYFTTKKSGNGLGLASCLSIVQRHAGTITVDSEPGVGATFQVFLPKSKEPDAGMPVGTAGANEEELPPKGSGRILVMDDMDGMKRVAGEILTVLGYDVCLTGDGAEAIQAYREAMEAGEPFCAVVLDLTVPGGMGGEEACWQLREYDPALVAVASSGYSTSNVMSEWKAHGFDAVVAKPYRIRDMGWVLHRLMNGRRAAIN